MIGLILLTILVIGISVAIIVDGVKHQKTSITQKQKQITEETLTELNKNEPVSPRDPYSSVSVARELKRLKEEFEQLSRPSIL